MILRNQAHTAQHGFGFFAVELRDTGELIGLAGLSRFRLRRISPPASRSAGGLPRRTGIGGSPRKRRGMPALWVRELALAEVVAFTVPANQRSRRVMEKLGMTRNPPMISIIRAFPKATVTPTCAVPHRIATIAIVTKFSIFFLLAASAFAQKQPITLETLNSAGRGGGRGGAGFAGSHWTPDGTHFVFRQGSSLMLYDPATKTSKLLIDTTPIDAAAVNVPPDDGPTDWTNRRARVGGMQFSGDGKTMLYSAGGDLFLIHTDTAKWEQLTKTPVAELDAKLSPDARMVAFRRGWDLYTVDVTSGKETRLTSDGTETLRNGIPDWVYPEELNLGTGFWWSPDSKSLCYLQFDSSREPVFPHADMLGKRAFSEPERYPQAGENNPDVHLGVIAATGGPTKWLEVGDTRNAYLIARAGLDAECALGVHPAHESRAEQTGDDLDRCGIGRSYFSVQRVRPALDQSRRRHRISQGRQALPVDQPARRRLPAHLSVVQRRQEREATHQGELGSHRDQRCGRKRIRRPHILHLQRAHAYGTAPILHEAGWLRQTPVDRRQLSRTTCR